ncbi:MAG: YkgJ family cysteine cluster protein [Planctomycetes bacterium]|nr:YkgJ family cysteine cluster protein [Planctomycetota bacterium]
MSHADYYRGAERAGEALARAGTDPSARARAVHAAIAPLLRDTEAAAASACRKGCAHCCHFPVGVTFPEAMLLAAAVRAEGEGAAGFVTASARYAGSTWRALVGRPCPFLRAGECAVHDVRPVPCRALASSDADACARGLGGRGAVPVDSEALWRGLGATDVLGCGEAAGSRELRSAVSGILGARCGEEAAAFLAAMPAGADDD